MAPVTMRINWSPSTNGVSASKTDETMSKLEVASDHSKFFMCWSSQLMLPRLLDHKGPAAMGHRVGFWGINRRESSRALLAHARLLSNRHAAFSRRVTLERKMPSLSSLSNNVRAKEKVDDWLSNRSLCLF